MRAFDALSLPLEGPRLVEASAGTGKTHAITTLVVRLVAERGLDIDRILVVTFTEAATAELRARIRTRLYAALAVASGESSGDSDLAAIAKRAGAAGRSRLAVALTNIDRAAVYTIHGFCHRTLLDSAFDSGARFDVELLTNTQALRDEALYDFWTQRLAAADPEVVRSLRSMKLSPTACRGLVDQVTRAPSMPVLPLDVGGAPPPGTDIFDEAFERARALWDGEAIESLLVESIALSRSRYRAEWVSQWCEETTRFFAQSRRGPVPDKLGKLTASGLREGVKKGFAGREPQHAFFDAAESLVARAEQYTDEAARHALGFKQDLTAFVRRELPAKKDRLGVMGFDDLLISLEQALSSPVFGGRLASAVRSRYPVALIDEFQDTDPTQWAIFRAIYGAGDMVLIGDPKQAIYAFRGADVFAYMAAGQHVPEASRYTMQVSWRSDPGYVAAVGRLYEGVASPFALDAIQYVPVTARPGAIDEIVGSTPFEILFVSRGDDKRVSSERLAQLPHAVAAHLQELLSGDTTLGGRPVAPGDVAVLTRTNRQAFEMQGALTLLGIHSVVLGDQSVFEDDEARELGLVLAAVVEPTNSQALRSALTTELCGVTATELAAMDASEAGDERWDAWVERFRSLGELWHTRGFVQMFRALLRETKMTERLLGLERGERRVTNILHLMELLQTAASAQHLGPRALLAWLADGRRPEAAKIRAEATQIRLESDAHAIRITTVHRAKGLEYPVVYCPYLWEGALLRGDDKTTLSFHDPDDGGRLKLDLEGSDEHVARAEHERFAENLRLLYVALTRAKHRSVLVWGALGQAWETSPLGYLLHAPPRAGADPSVAEVKAHLGSLDDTRLKSDLERVAGTHIRVGTLDLDRVGVGAPAATGEIPELTARHVREPFSSWWRTASFSQLTADRSRATHSLDPAEGRDRDAAPALGETPVEGGGEKITLDGFPRGPKAGDFFHDVLEHLDFTDEAALAPLVEERLRAHGYDPAHQDVVVRSLSEVLATSLPSGQRRRISLRNIPKERRLDELEFYFPVANPAVRTVPRGAQLALSFAGQAASAIGKLSADKLAEPFAHHPSPELDPHYAERVRRLGFLPLEGFLKGYVDLVFEAQGRWYVVDYKSNHLGDHLGDYGQKALRAAMSHGHYYLQAHLYAVAVHRFLGRRLSGYRYGRHFGGILYLFIKGMRPGSVDEGGHSTGVFFERPPVERIEHLSVLLDLPPRQRGER